MKKYLSTLWTIALFLFPEAAYSTMPLLSEKPQLISPSTCQKWAATQDNDAIEMWGIQADGNSSKALALQRLTDDCLGQPAPEIVGFGSSAGFDDSYCQKHSEQKICSDQHPSQDAKSASEVRTKPIWVVVTHKMLACQSTIDDLSLRDLLLNTLAHPPADGNFPDGCELLRVGQKFLLDDQQSESETKIAVKMWIPNCIEGCVPYMSVVYSPPRTIVGAYLRPTRPPRGF